MHPSARDYSLFRDAPHAAVSGLRTDCGRDLDPSLARTPAWRHVLLDGNPALLSAAVIIRNANNLIITSNALPPDSLVRFLKEPSGTIFRVWILTPAEAEASRPSIFDFMRQNGQR